MNMKPRITLCRRLAGVLLAACAAVVAAPAWSRADTYKIGLISPMSGANARYGAFANKGANLAVKEINAARGVLGTKIELASGDSQCVPRTGAADPKRSVDPVESRPPI